MKCRAFTFFAFLAFLFLSFTFSFLEVNDTFADNRLNFTIDTTTTAFDICGGTSGVSCSDYSYFSFDIRNNNPDENNGVNFRFVIPNSYTIFSCFATLSTSCIISYTSNVTQIRVQFPQIFSGSFSGFLSDSAPTGSCPEVPDPEPCPVIPENPYDEKLDSINSSIIMVSATALVIYFFFCFYRLFIKPLGGL